jgi:ABC-2 type transport system ATP-binding protein
MDNLAVDIQQLTKIYAAPGKGEFKLALDKVDLQIPKGSIFGLLGPNGAGKSTLINIMAGLLLGSGGQVRIWGYEILRNPREAKSSIGVVPQEINYDPFFTPAKLLDIQAGLYGVPKKERRTAELLEMVGLSDKANAYTRSLSGGMKRRLMIAKAMVHTPPILVLDEPTAGVDVELRNQLWANIRTLNQQGVTILLTTHYLKEAEELCDRIAIINKGRIIANDTKANLLNHLEIKALTVRFEGPLAVIPDKLRVFGPERISPDAVTFRYNPTLIHAGQIIAALQAEDLKIRDISTRESSLEDVFLTLTAGGAQADLPSTPASAMSGAAMRS